MREQAFLNAGLHITIMTSASNAPPSQRSSGMDAMCYEGGIREFVTVVQPPQNAGARAASSICPASKGDRHGGGRACSITTRLRRDASSPSPTTSIRPRAACTRTGFKRGAHPRAQRLRQIKKGYIKGDDKVSGEDVPRGSDRHHLRQADRRAV